MTEHFLHWKQTADGCYRPIADGQHPCDQPVMKITGARDPDKKISIELDMTEVGHLISFLMHAKFSDDVRLTIVGSPTMRGILSGLLEEGRALHEYSGWFSRAVSWEIGNEEGVNPPPSFFKIEDDLKGRSVAIMWTRS